MLNKGITNGYVSFDTPDGKQTAHFSMNAWRVLKEDFNSTPQIEGEKLNKQDVVPVFEAMTRVIYSAAKAYSLENGMDFDYTEFQVGNWVDVMLKKDYQTILQALNSTSQPPKTNSTPGKKKRK